MEKIWLKNYPDGVPAGIDPEQYGSLAEMLEEAMDRYSSRVAFRHMRTTLTFAQLDSLSHDFAAFLQNAAGLEKGDRLGVQLPNILQFPIVLIGALRAGVVVVNSNPLYTPRELEYQYKDAGARALVVFENEAHKIDRIIDRTDIETVVVTGLGDLMGFPGGALINAYIKYVKRMVPSWRLGGSWRLRQALREGKTAPFDPPRLTGNDMAFLQYTGGTTGSPKGAVLTHKNVVANVLQISAWMKPLLTEGEETAIAALPLYHIFALTVNCLAMLHYGASSILITDPRDMPAFVRTLKRERFTFFPGLNTLFNALMNTRGFEEIDFGPLKISVAGGMALQESVARRWEQLTGTSIVEGYGLTETSPVACCNPGNGTARPGTIGLPLPSTDIRLIDDNGNEIAAAGESGELCISGPQVMSGYWRLPEETAEVLSSDGWLKTGDVAQFDADGFFRIVDRKKDMILVSGFNVYPNEIEDTVATHAGVREVAAVGIPDDKSTEAVKLYVVKKDPALTADELIHYCSQHLAAYKVPKQVEFCEELPKTNIGKVLRRKLQEP